MGAQRVMGRQHYVDLGLHCSTAVLCQVIMYLLSPEGLTVGYLVVIIGLQRCSIQSPTLNTKSR